MRTTSCPPSQSCVNATRFPMMSQERHSWQLVHPPLRCLHALFHFSLLILPVVLALSLGRKPFALLTLAYPDLALLILAYPCSSLLTLAYPCSSLLILAYPDLSLLTLAHPCLSLQVALMVSRMQSSSSSYPLLCLLCSSQVV